MRQTTLLSLLCGLLAPESGEVLYMGQKISADKRQQFGYMLQKDHLFEWRSIRRNVLLGLEIQKKLTPKTVQYADRLLETYGLSSFSEKRPSELSGGMRQRAALIRTLVLKPELLLLDEPFLRPGLSDTVKCQRRYRHDHQTGAKDRDPRNA